MSSIMTSIDVGVAALRTAAIRLYELYDRFGVGLAAAITTWISFEALLNMATVTNTLPITGVPLPFFSYGGTALATTLAATGVLLSIARSGTGSSLGRTDEAIDRWRRDRRAPVSGARRRPSSSS